MLAYYTGGTGHPGKWRDGLHWHDHVLRKFPDWTVDDLVEVYNDPNQVVIRPDPKSKTGRSYEVIGWSARLGRVITLTMLVNKDGDTECCATCHPTKGRYLRLYRGEDGEQQ